MSRSRAVRRRAVAFLIVLATATAPSRPSRAQETADVPAVAIRLAPPHEHYRPRIEAAARESVRQYREWLRSPPPQGLVIDDGSPEAAGSAAAIRVTLALPWISAPSTMDVESRVAFGLARAWWPGWTQGAEARPIVDGLAWYLQSRVTADLFGATFQRPGYSAESVHYFGGTIPWTFPALVRGPWTAGLGRQAFLQAGRAGAGQRPGPWLPPDADLLTPRVALAFATIERLAGWPAVEGALAALAPRASAGAMAPGEIEQVLASAVGYPLSWLMGPALEGRRFDYAIESVSTAACEGQPCWRTTVAVVNRGDAVFSGVDGQVTGPYPRGDALELLVRFDGGAQSTARWDGRAPGRTFVFESATPAVTVQLDPAGLLLLDSNSLDHAWRAEADTSVPLGQWVAWWLIWMQDAVLSHTGLI